MIGTAPILQPRRFVFHGDSNTYGNSDPANAWPTKLKAFPLFSGLPFTNLAQNGWTVEQVAADYPITARPLSPAVTGVAAHFHLHIGSNNLTIGGGGNDIFLALYDILQTALDDGFLISATNLWKCSSFSGAQNTQRGILNTDFGNTVGFWKFFYNANVAFPDPTDTTYFLGDGTHLNPVGQQRYAQGVYDLLLSTKTYL